jgi:hypothetical protein
MPESPLFLMELWKSLPAEQRRQTLAALSHIIAKQLQPPPRQKEVAYEKR